MDPSQFFGKEDDEQDIASSLVDIFYSLDANR